MLEKEFQFYLNSQEQLVQKYNGKHVVIKGEEVLGAYETLSDAYFETTEEHAVGSFMIQLCTPGKDDYTQNYRSRVAFRVAAG
jgi:hypothetical protein